MTGERAEAARTVERYLQDTGLNWEPGVHEHEFVVVLPGEKKLKTDLSLRVRERDLLAEAFVIRKPDENAERFYAYLLRANLRLPGLAYGINKVGDVFLTGRLPLSAVDDAQLDALLGAVLSATDDPFNDLLAIGFLTSMRKEWAWRISRGESTRNLEAFRHLLEEPGDRHTP